MHDQVSNHIQSEVVIEIPHKSLMALMKGMLEQVVGYGSPQKLNAWSVFRFNVASHQVCSYPGRAIRIRTGVDNLSLKVSIVCAGVRAYMCMCVRVCVRACVHVSLPTCTCEYLSTSLHLLQRPLCSKNPPSFLRP